MIRETVTRLEMTSPNQLMPGRRPPRQLELAKVEPAAAPLVRSIYTEIGKPHGWTGRANWSDTEWERELSRSGVRSWIAKIDEHVAGLLELEAEPSGDVGIVVFGLLPEFVGRGFGGEFLTQATRLAWDLMSPDGLRTRRVWIETSSRDHPHAIPNYRGRGFRVFQTESRARERLDTQGPELG